MRGVRTLRSLDETHQRCLATSKVDPPLNSISDWETNVQGPLSGPCFGDLFSKVNKNVTGPDYRVSRLQMDTK